MILAIRGLLGCLHRARHKLRRDLFSQRDFGTQLTPQFQIIDSLFMGYKVRFILCLDLKYLFYASLSIQLLTFEIKNSNSKLNISDYKPNKNIALQFHYYIEYHLTITDKKVTKEHHHVQ